MEVRALPAAVPGIHHVTSITGDVQKNVDFYVAVLGLRFVKKSINQDVPDTYHLYFGDYLGSPGTAMTFFGWPAWPQRRTGSGQVTTVGFTIPEGSFEFWVKRLRDLHVASSRATRFDADVITIHDPDGIELDLVAGRSSLKLTPWPDGPVPPEHAIHGFHSVTLTVAEAQASVDFLTRTMGFRQKAQDGRRTRFETGGGGPDSILDLVESPEGPAGEESIGTVHHVAWRAPDDKRQAEWRETLAAAGRNVTPVIDRWYFTRMVSDPKNWNVMTRCTGWETRDLVGHMIDVMEGYFKNWDAARAGKEGTALGLPVMGETLNDHALDFRKLSREEALDRFKKDAQKLDKMLADLTPEQWTSFMVYHPFAGPVPAGFYGTFQIMDYGVHPYDIEYGLGNKLATIDEATAGLILPFAFVFWQYTVDEKNAKGLDFTYALQVDGPWGGKWRVTVQDGKWSAVPEKGDFKGVDALFHYNNAADAVLSFFQRFPGGSASGDPDVIEAVRHLHFRF